VTEGILIAILAAFCAKKGSNLCALRQKICCLSPTLMHSLFFVVGFLIIILENQKDVLKIEKTPPDF
jgi:hypothetical protein